MKKLSKQVRLSLFLAVLMLMSGTFAFQSMAEEHHSKPFGRSVHTKKEILQKIQNELVNPMFTSLKKSRPDLAIMKKCFTGIKYDIFGKEIHLALNNPKDLERNEVEGNVTLINCGQREHICKYKLNLTSNVIQVKESLLKPWISLDVLLKQIENSKPHKP